MNDIDKKLYQKFLTACQSNDATFIIDLAELNQDLLKEFIRHDGFYGFYLACREGSLNVMTLHEKYAKD